MLMVHPRERESKSLTSFRVTFVMEFFFIVNYEGTILSGHFPKENRDTEGNLLLCPLIITVDSLYFFFPHSNKKKPFPKQKN